jgi:phage gp16-like protein
MPDAESTKDAGPSKDEVSRVMAALGRKGGKVGGNARANALTKERRSEIAKAAAKKRWGVKRMTQKDKRVAALIATQII